MNKRQIGSVYELKASDYLTKKGIPFRTAYKISGQAVAYCIDNGLILETVPLDVYKSFCPDIDDDVYSAIDLLTCVRARVSAGGTGKDSVEKQIKIVSDFLSK